MVLVNLYYLEHLGHLYYQSAMDLEPLGLRLNLEHLLGMVLDHLWHPVLRLLLSHLVVRLLVLPSHPLVLLLPLVKVLGFLWLLLHQWHLSHLLENYLEHLVRL